MREVSIEEGKSLLEGDFGRMLGREVTLSNGPDNKTGPAPDLQDILLMQLDAEEVVLNRKEKLILKDRQRRKIGNRPLLGEINNNVRVDRKSVV